MNSRVIAALLAALLAIVGIAALWVYAAGADRRAFDGAELQTVYRVKAPIEANADAAAVESNVEKVEVPSAAVAKGAVTDLASIDGLRTTVPLVVGEQLIVARFDKAGSQAAQSASVPAGLQEVAVKLDAAAAVTERIDEGARVGVIVTFEEKDDKRGRMVAQNLLVTSVDRADDGSVVVSVAVNTAQATQIAVGAQFGQVRLTVQNDKTDRSGTSAVEAGALVK